MTAESQIDQEVSSYKNKLKRAVALVLQDNLPEEGVEALFYHGRSFGDDVPIIHEVARLVKHGNTKNVIVHGNDGERVGNPEKFKANAGKSEVARKLDAQEVDIMDHVWFSSSDSLHTRAETSTYIDLTLEKGWKSIGLIAHPHQLPRIMLGTVQELNSRKIFLPVYAISPELTAWDEVVFGSQGMEGKPRRQHALDEMFRIPLYQKKGDLPTFEDLDNYLDKRGGLDIIPSRNFEVNYSIIEGFIDQLTPDQIFPK